MQYIDTAALFFLSGSVDCIVKILAKQLPQLHDCLQTQNSNVLMTMTINSGCCLEHSVFLHDKHTSIDPVIAYHLKPRGLQVVAPKRASLADANKRLDGANKKLTGIRAKVKELKDRVASLEDSLMKVHTEPQLRLCLYWLLHAAADLQ